MFDTGLVGALKQVATVAGVITVVLQWVGDRFGNNSVRGKVQYRAYLMFF